MMSKTGKYPKSKFSSCLHLFLPEQFDLLLLISQFSSRRLGILCQNFWMNNQYLFPDKGHDSDPGKNMLPRQSLTWDSVSKGLCTICPWLTQMSHEQRHIGPDGRRHFTVHVIPLRLPAHHILNSTCKRSTYNISSRF